MSYYINIVILYVRLGLYVTIIIFTYRPNLT